MDSLLCLLFMGSLAWACTGDVEVHGVPKTIQIVWPPCEPGQTMFCTKSKDNPEKDAGTD